MSTNEKIQKTIINATIAVINGDLRKGRIYLQWFVMCDRKSARLAFYREIEQKTGLVYVGHKDYQSERSVEEFANNFVTEDALAERLVAFTHVNDRGFWYVSTEACPTRKFDDPVFQRAYRRVFPLVGAKQAWVYDRDNRVVRWVSPSALLNRYHEATELCRRDWYKKYQQGVEERKKAFRTPAENAPKSYRVRYANAKKCENDGLDVDGRAVREQFQMVATDGYEYDASVVFMPTDDLGRLGAARTYVDRSYGNSGRERTAWREDRVRAEEIALTLDPDRLFLLDVEDVGNQRGWAFVPAQSEMPCFGDFSAHVEIFRSREELAAEIARIEQEISTTDVVQDSSFDESFAMAVSAAEPNTTEIEFDFCGANIAVGVSTSDYNKAYIVRIRQSLTVPAFRKVVGGIWDGLVVKYSSKTVSAVRSLRVPKNGSVPTLALKDDTSSSYKPSLEVAKELVSAGLSLGIGVADLSAMTFEELPWEDDPDRDYLSSPSRHW